jgi:predicted transcriptional regulator
MWESIWAGKRRQRGWIELSFNSVEKIQEIPDFQAILNYREFLSIELENLLLQEASWVYDLSTFDIEKLVRGCNLSFRNILNFASLITENWIYWELNSDSVTINLTKEWIINLDRIIKNYNIDDFLRNNLLTENDFTWGKMNTNILAIWRMVRRRWFDKLTGVPGSKFIYNAFEEMEEWVDYTQLRWVWKDRYLGICILSPGIEKLITHVNSRLKEAILPKYLEK